MATLIVEIMMVACTIQADPITITVIDSQRQPVSRVNNLTVSDSVSFSRLTDVKRLTNNSFRVKGVAGFRDIWLRVAVELPGGTLDTPTVKCLPESGDWPKKDLEVVYIPPDSSSRRVPAGYGGTYQLAFIQQRYDHSRHAIGSTSHWQELYPINTAYEPTQIFQRTPVSSTVSGVYQPNTVQCVPCVPCTPVYSPTSAYPW